LTVKYVGTLLQGEDTRDYLDATLLVRPDPPGAVQYMAQQGINPNQTISIDGHPTNFGGESAIFIDGLFETFHGILVNSADSEHRIEAMLIHRRSPVPGSNTAPQPPAGAPSRSKKKPPSPTGKP
jgi:hypothetical protein